MANQGGRDVQHGPAPNQYSSFKDFIDTMPPSFREAEEPLQAEEWLNTVEQKFRLLRLNEGLKAEYAAHQLQGPAGIWWNQHREALPDNTVVDWNLFREAFKGHFIPLGVMEMKHTEFIQLTQGNKTLKKYLHAFNHLLRYAPEFVSTESKKIASFKRGLGPKLLKTMGRTKCATFNEFVSDALTQENYNTAYTATKTHKQAFEVGAGASQSKAPVAARPQNRAPTPNMRYHPPAKKNQAKTGFRKGYFIALPRGNTGPSYAKTERSLFGFGN